MEIKLGMTIYIDEEYQPAIDTIKEMINAQALVQEMAAKRHKEHTERLWALLYALYPGLEQYQATYDGAHKRVSVIGKID